MLQSLPDQAPRWASFVLDVRMVIFTLATCIVSALLFGWAPAAGQACQRDCLAATRH